MRTTLNKVYDRYRKPVIIAENGFGAKDQLEADGTIHDSYRIDYFKEHFAEIVKARDIDQVNVIAYIAWGSLILYPQAAVRWINAMVSFMLMLIMRGMEIIVDTRKIAFIGIVLLLKRIRRESKSNEKVLFICSGGMSSAIVEKALDKEAEKRNCSNKFCSRKW